MTKVDEEELARLAMAADIDAPLADDAVPFVIADEGGRPLLPDWYMPAPALRAGSVKGWRRVFAWVVIVALVALMAAGLCSTDGFVTIA